MTLTQITEKGIKDGEIVNADINASAAIAKSKLASLDIVNGDINASAAIAKSKLASLNIVNADVNSSAAIAKEKLEDFVTGNSNNRLLTATGNTNSLTGESSFTYNGNGGLDMEGTAAAFFQIKTPDSTDGGVYFRTGTTNAGAISYLHNSTLADGVMNFRSGGTNKMVIKGNGRVGINSTNPACKFHITDTYHFLAAGGNSTTGMKIGNYDGTNYGVLTTRGSVLRFDIDDTNKMRIAADGKIHMNYASDSSAGNDRLNIMGGGDGITIARSTANASDGNILGNISFHSYMSGSYHSNAEAKIEAIADSGQSGSSAPTHLDFYTKKSGTSPGASPTLQMRIKSSGDVEISDGDLQLDNGHGIDFHNYGTGTNIDSNKLDDYEEGTFTPVMSGSTTTGSPSYDLQNGAYTKIGRQITVSVNIAVNNIGGAAGNMRISGFPFTPKSGTEGVTVAQWNQLGAGLPSGTSNACPIIQNPNTYLELRCNNNAGTTYSKLGVQTVNYLRFVLTYFTA